MRIYKLTCLASVFNAALGSGKFTDIHFHEVLKRIEDESIFEYLEQRLDAMVPFSMLNPADRLELILDWSNMRGCIEPFRYDGHRNGLALLVGYLLEGIQRRASNPQLRMTTEQVSRVFAPDCKDLLGPMGARPETDDD